MLVRRLRPGIEERTTVCSPLGRWGLPVNVLAVAWGVLIILNVGWPRAEVYGDAWYRLYAAPLATLAMLGAGWACRAWIGRRTSGVLEEHRAPVLALATAGAIEESFD